MQHNLSDIFFVVYNLLNSSDNIDGTQTFLTQLLAVKLKSIEKRGKIQTTKMNKFSNLNICSTKREPNPQWPLTATIGLNFWSEVGSPIPMTSQWPQTDQKEGNILETAKKRLFEVIGIGAPMFDQKLRLMKVIGAGFPFSWNEALGSPLFDQTSTTQIKKKGTY